jgi:hypothetical protein
VVIVSAPSPAGGGSGGAAMCSFLIARLAVGTDHVVLQPRPAHPEAGRQRDRGLGKQDEPALDIENTPTTAAPHVVVILRGPVRPGPQNLG